MTSDLGWLRALVRDVPDFPEPGVQFKDLTPLLADTDALRYSIDFFADHFCGQGIDLVAGIEARGFLLAAPVAYRLGVGMVPIRKPGKLPSATTTKTYDLEYGTDTLEIHTDAVAPGQRVLVIDDVLATGGSAAAAVELLVGLGAQIAGCAFLIELAFLGGAGKLEGHDITRMLTYE